MDVNGNTIKDHHYTRRGVTSARLSCDAIKCHLLLLLHDSQFVIVIRITNPLVK